MSPPKCLGLGRIFGHNYQARESRVERQGKLPSDYVLSMVFSHDTADTIRASKLVTTTYHGDICARCGDFIPAPRTPEKAPLDPSSSEAKSDVGQTLGRKTP